jgi:hypothetical protein
MLALFATLRSAACCVYSLLWCQQTATGIDAILRAPANHNKQPELNCWETNHKSIKTHLLVAATVSTGHRASLRVDLVPVKAVVAALGRCAGRQV